MTITAIRHPVMPSISDMGSELTGALSAVKALDALQVRLPGIDRILRVVDATRSAGMPSVRAVLAYEVAHRSPPERRREEMVMGCVDAFFDHTEDRRPSYVLRRAHSYQHRNSVDNTEVRYAGFMRHEGGPAGTGMLKDRSETGSIPDHVRSWENLLLDQGSGSHPLIRSIVAHGMLASISPFHAGNGEIARMMLPLSHRWLSGGYGSASVGEAYASYGDVYRWALEEASETGNASTLCRVMLNMIEEDAVRNAVRLRRIVELRQQWRDAVREYRFDAHIHRFVDWISVRPVYNVRTATMALRISTHIFYKINRRLVERGIVTRPTRRPWLFHVPEIIDMFDGSSEG